MNTLLVAFLLAVPTIAPVAPTPKSVPPAGYVMTAKEEAILDSMLNDWTKQRTKELGRPNSPQRLMAARMGKLFDARYYANDEAKQWKAAIVQMLASSRSFDRKMRNS